MSSRTRFTELYATDNSIVRRFTQFVYYYLFTYLFAGIPIYSHLFFHAVFRLFILYLLLCQYHVLIIIIARLNFDTISSGDKRSRRRRRRRRAVSGSKQPECRVAVRSRARSINETPRRRPRPKTR